MIDTLYQGQINKTLDDQVQRPGALPPAQGPSTFTGFWRGLGGVPGGAALGFGSFADVTEGMAKLDASQGLVYNPATHTYTRLPIDESSIALQKQIKEQGIGSLYTSEAGDTFRSVAKDYMPDAKTTGSAGQILANGTAFLTQASVAMTTSGPVIGAGEVGALAGMQEADKLREEGVDRATREKAGLAVGVGTGASMLLPMSGASWWIRGAKGAAGGAATYAAQTQAEKMILQQGGYNQLASQYDPLDPVGLTLSAAVPGVLGATLGHAAPSKVPMPDGISSDHSAAAAAQRIDNDIAAVQREMARKGVTPEQAQILQQELDRLHGERNGPAIREAMAADPSLEPAARVQQTARAMDSARLTPDDDLAGLERHQRALETAADQMGAGEPVDVMPVFGDSLFDSMRQSRALADRIDFLEERRAQLLGDAGNLLEPGEASALRQQIVDLKSQLTDAGEAAVKARAKELQGENVSYKQATKLAQRELTERLGDQQATIDRLQQRLDQHAAAAQASEHIGLLDHDLAAARERADGVAGPKTSPRRLSIAVANALREMQEKAPRSRPNPEAFHTARAEAEAAKAGEGGAAAGETNSTPPAEAPAGRAAPEPAAGPSDAHLEAAVAGLDQDMLVHMDGMEQPVRLGDLMESLREQAAHEGRDAQLLEVAAQCAISFGTAG